MPEMRKILKQQPENWQGRHLLRCTHSLNSESKILYWMYCDVLGMTPSGRLKIKVYGYRHRSVDGEKIRYVHKRKVELAADYGIAKESAKNHGWHLNTAA